MKKYFVEERKTREKIREVCPEHPVLNIIFSSTYVAIETYWRVLEDLV